MARLQWETLGRRIGKRERRWIEEESREEVGQSGNSTSAFLSFHSSSKETREERLIFARGGGRGMCKGRLIDRGFVM